MKEHPILFNTEMVKAILDGRKSQTRRLMKPQPVFVSDRNLASSCWYPSEPQDLNDKREPGLLYANERYFRKSVHEDFAPYQVGDRLWVRETWRVSKSHDALSPKKAVQALGVNINFGGIDYAATPSSRPWRGRWRPSIHMPRRASRITLEVTAVRCERVQEISAWDATQEGLTPGTDIVSRFQDLWQSLYPGSRERDDWVFVYEVKRVSDD